MSGWRRRRRVLVQTFAFRDQTCYRSPVLTPTSGIKHLESLPGPKPAVNQIELHPWCQQKPIVAYCQANGIALQAYCPLVRADEKRWQDPVLQEICKKVGKGEAQVLVRWSLQKG